MMDVMTMLPAMMAPMVMMLITNKADDNRE